MGWILSFSAIFTPRHRSDSVLLRVTTWIRLAVLPGHRILAISPYTDPPNWGRNCSVGSGLGFVVFCFFGPQAPVRLCTFTCHHVDQTCCLARSQYHGIKPVSPYTHPKLGRNSAIGSVLGFLSCTMQLCGFAPPLRRIFSGKRGFPLELIWVLPPILKTPSDESINRDLVCAHMHSISRTRQIMTFMS